MNDLYDITELNYEILDFLRNNTHLGPIATIKVQTARHRAEQWCKDYIKISPNDQLDIDYSQADELEYQLRLTAWVNNYEKLWQTSKDGTSLSEFAISALYEKMEELKKNPKR